MAKRNSVGSMQRNLQSSKHFQPQYGTAQDEEGENGICAALITFFSYILVFLTLPISIWGCVKVRVSYVISSQSSLLSTSEDEREKERVFSNTEQLLCSGGAGVRESSHIPAGTTPLWRSQRSGIVLCPPLYRHIQVSLQQSLSHLLTSQS